MKKNRIKFGGLLLFALLTAATGCKKDEQKPDTPAPPINEQELITTFTITFADAAGIQPTVEATFRDIDGEGGNPPTTFDDIVLQNNTTYHATITLLNEAVNPAENVTEEVEEEGNQHLFCFEPTSVNLTIVRTDSDGTYGIGITSDWTTGDTSSGTVLISLKHQPGVKNGTCDPGETDLEVLFNVVVE